MLLLRGCLYEENCPGFIPAKRGPRSAGTIFSVCLYENYLSRQTETDVLSRGFVMIFFAVKKSKWPI